MLGLMRNPSRAMAAGRVSLRLARRCCSNTNAIQLEVPPYRGDVQGILSPNPRATCAGVGSMTEPESKPTATSSDVQPPTLPLRRAGDEHTVSYENPSSALNPAA